MRELDVLQKQQNRKNKAHAGKLTGLGVLLHNSQVVVHQLLTLAPQCSLIPPSRTIYIYNYVTSHCKNELVVFTTERLPSYRQTGETVVKATQ